ncbi:hypothetical protein [Burkholderia cenocepacia]|uniref:hypothetical protein n=1 Tax=Burkholderia cenocepacia TaxID=95486 RepID=UPI001B9D1DAA|nr:hypothetical protein [Burkholderia cenocepacia]MBR8409477.1 hypothetical protein [Burkholderia cenocepacia]
MTNASVDGLEELEQLIIHHVPRDALMACEDAYHNGDVKGRTQASNFAQGHRPSAAGQVKHFYINEAFYEALQAHGADPTPLRGTRLVVGRWGIFNVARLNVPGHQWVNLRRSATRKKLAEVNESIQRQYVQQDLFADASEVSAPTGGTIFILGVMDGLDGNGIAQLTQVMLALPAPNMKSWLYRKSIGEFLSLYDQGSVAEQADNAQPKLKTQPKKQTGNDQGN